MIAVRTGNQCCAPLLWGGVTLFHDCNIIIVAAGLRTDQNGWIEITTDGQNMWLQVERE